MLAFLALTCACPPVDDPAGDVDDAPVQPASCALDADGTAVDDDCDPYDQVNFLGTQSIAVCSFLFDCCSGVERNDTLPLILGAASAERSAAGDLDAGTRALDQLLVVEPDLLGDELACVRALALAQSSTLRDDVVALLDEDGARRTFDRDAAEVCIGQLEEAAELCAPPLLLLPEAQPPECARLFAPAVAEGGRCTSDADCLAIPPDDAPATCFALDGPDGPDDVTPDGTGFDVSLSGTCAPLPGLGDACAFERGACEAGLFCSSALVCLPIAGEGELCGERPCGPGLRCLGACSPLVPSGQGLENACLVNEDCLSGLCVTVAVDDQVFSLCTDPPVIDPLAVRFDFCLDDRGNASLGDLVPP